MVAGVIISLFLQIRPLQMGEIRDLGEAFGEPRQGALRTLAPNPSSDLKPKGTENATEREKEEGCVSPS